MEITEVRVKLINNKDERLRAFCSMTLDNDFVVRDIKVIQGTNGYFVAMPSRKMSDHCPKCGGKNHLRARFCNNCGASLSEDRAKKDMKGRMKLHADIAHPINTQCRQTIQDKIVEAYEAEIEKSAEPGYKPVEFDEPDDDVPDDVAEQS
jgi:stage V sporulation protein G